MASADTTLQTVYAAIGDCADGKVSEETLVSQLEDAGRTLDARQQQVVEGLLTSKLDADLAEEAVEALKRGAAAGGSKQ